MLASQFRSTGRGASPKANNSPYVFFYQLGDLLEIAVDEKTYGNDSRFCRRSSNFNAELRHVVDKGSLHLFIVTIKNVEKNQEIFLPLDVTTSGDSTLQSISADLREIKKPVNGLLNTSTDDEPLALRDSKDRKKKERKKSKKGTADDSPMAAAAAGAAGRKTRAQQLRSPKPEPELKTEIKEEVVEDVKLSPLKMLASPKVKKEEEEEIFSDSEKSPAAVLNGRDKPPPPQLLSPVKGGGGPHQKASPTGPSMLGLPDSKGLIVGVNTINYDASSSVRNKAKVKKASIWSKKSVTHACAKYKRKEKLRQSMEISATLFVLSTPIPMVVSLLCQKISFGSHIFFSQAPPTIKRVT